MAIPDSTTLKRCSKKEQCVHPEAKDGWLPATDEYFPIDKSRKCGLYPRCKTCGRRWYAEHIEERREYDRRRYAENPEPKREQTRRYALENHEAVLNRKRRYYLEHAEERRRYTLQWQLENPDKKRANQRRYRQMHPEADAVNWRNYRARKLAAPGTHTAADIEIQFKRQRGKCYYCGCKLTKKPRLPHSATVDHVIPLTRDNTSNAPDNLVIACRTCNFSKGNKLPHEWLKGGRLL